MARAIDGELLELEIANIANKLAKSDAQKALMGRVMYCVEHMPTLTPPNEPLMLDELREMDGEPVYVVSAIGERPEWYIVDIEENEFKNPWDSISLENCDEGYPYTAYRRPPEKEEDT